MTAGRLDRSMIDAADSRDELVHWVIQATNCEDADVDDEGSVWTGNSWLDQDACDRIKALFDTGEMTRLGA
jgi:hypothetical protein